VSKRLSNRWQFMASYSATKKHIPLLPNVGTEFGTTIYVNTDDPNAQINNFDNTWEWVGSASGAYTFPWQDVLVGVNFQSRSGVTFARQALFTGGQQIPSITLNVEPIGTEQYPTINLLDLRVEKTLNLMKRHHVGLRLNVYNSLNASTVTSQTILTGVNFLKPTAILPPRTFELSASYKF
jgi:outer membrane receptor protein involved in Fe transport